MMASSSGGILVLLKLVAMISTFGLANTRVIGWPLRISWRQGGMTRDVPVCTCSCGAGCCSLLGLSILWLSKATSLESMEVFTVMIFMIMETAFECSVELIFVAPHLNNGKTLLLFPKSTVYAPLLVFVACNFRHTLIQKMMKA